MLIQCWWERRMAQLLWKTAQRLLKEIKTRATIWSGDLTSGGISKKIEIKKSKRYLYPHIHYSITHNSHDMEANQMFINRWMDKEMICIIYIHIYTHTRVCWIFKKGDSATCDCVDDLENIMPSEVSQSQDTYRLIPLIWAVYNSQPQRSRE